MSAVYEGIVRGGHIELIGHPQIYDGSHVRVTVTYDAAPRNAQECESAKPEPSLREWALEVARRHATESIHSEPRRPSGAPLNLPTDEEWAERAKRAVELMRQWQREPPSDDLATSDEIARGLRENPIRFREVKIDE